MIQLSPSAIEEIRRLKTRYPNPQAYFRLRVESGGCAGLLYITKFDDTLTPQDRVYDCNGIQVAIDSQSAPYLNNLDLDFSEDLMGGSFRFHNPNTQKSCGCGVSFSIDER